MGFSVEFAQRIFMFITLRVRNFFWYFKAFHRRQNSSAAFLVNDYTKFNLYKIIKIIKLSFLHQSTWTYKWLVKWDYRIYIFLSWLILTSQNWKEIVEKKTFVWYLERKIARTLKLLLIPWKLFFSQTNHIATAWKWKLAIIEPTRRYM